MIAYDMTFDPKVFLRHCDLILCFSDFALYLNTQLVFFDTAFRLQMALTRPFILNVLIGHCDLISWFSDFALYLNTQ